MKCGGSIACAHCIVTILAFTLGQTFFMKVNSDDKNGSKLKRLDNENKNMSPAMQLSFRHALRFVPWRLHSD